MKEDIPKITINKLLAHENKKIREGAKKIKAKYDRIFHNDHMSLTVTLDELGDEYKEFIEFVKKEQK